MKWNSVILGFIGTSENLMALSSAPMYSLKIVEDWEANG